MKVNNSSRYIYDKKWEEIFPITQVESDAHVYYCITCAKKYYCRHNEIRNVRAHCKSLSHIRNVSRQIYGTTNIESENGVPLESSIGIPSQENKSRDMTYSTSLHPTNEPGRFICQKKQPKQLETSDIQLKELDDESKVKDFFEKCKKAYLLDPNFEMDHDLHTAMGQNVYQILKHLNEGNTFRKKESQFLGYVLTSLKNYKEQMY
ncbi:hypothetical protein RF11_13069 [Thelohanellus kitauei]|uniref:Uncharacterized protein n=1 Tax=Thelohanellus kitauei TaxID=669202 RepID=A0A0C2JKC2_THEKT|nr:hypothetical protein RF11_13069 [Thelohanellus kitauei]